MSRPLEEGKLLYCFPFNGHTFIDLVAWSGLFSTGTVIAQQSLQVLLQDIQTYRVAEGKARAQGKTEKSPALLKALSESRAQISMTLATRGDLQAGVESASGWEPLKSTRRDGLPASGGSTRGRWERGWLKKLRSSSARPRRSQRVASGSVSNPPGAAQVWREGVLQFYLQTHPLRDQLKLSDLSAHPSWPNHRQPPTAVEDGATNTLPPHQDWMDDDCAVTLAIGVATTGQVDRVVAYVHRAMVSFASTMPPALQAASVNCVSLAALVKRGVADEVFIDLKRAEDLRVMGKLPSQDTTSALRDAVSDQPTLRYDKADALKGMTRFNLVMDAIQAPADLRSCVSEYTEFFGRVGSDDREAVQETFGDTWDERRAMACKVLAAVTVVRCLMDFLRRKGKVVCDHSIPHSLWFLERSAQGPFLVIQALIKRWRKRADQ